VYRCGFAAQKTRHYLTSTDGLGHVEGPFDSKKEAAEELGGREVMEQYSVDEPEPVENALYSVKRQIKMICDATNADEYTVFLTGKDNFRDEEAITYGYKANRKDSRKPVHHQAIRDYLMERHDAQLITGNEADDAMAWCQYKAVPTLIDPNDGSPVHMWEESTTCIASIDKDLKMVPGWHFNFAKPDDGMIFMSELAGMQWFYQQMLMGDTTDNIIGLSGVGPKTAKAFIDPCETEQEMFDVAFEQYCKTESIHYEFEELLDMGIDITFSDFVHLRMTENGRLLWMKQHEEDLWHTPT
jgi:5'-3' exonuclease